ncbi:MAG: hypothetical protein JNG83_14670 [Opitutaceae bacterium]|nr:hypothetical protein [Opitutaceae bacterium]
MDNKPKSADLKLPRNGFYVQGVVISNSARVFKKKDGSGVSVKVVAELALQPGVANYERFFDPAKDVEVKVQGEEVVSYPKLAEFSTITLRVERYRVFDEKLSITAAEKVG